MPPTNNRAKDMEKHPLLIGIDPDTQASGWACLDLSTRTLHLETIPFFDIVRLLDEWKSEVEEKYLDEEYSYRFVLEDVWSTSANWHLSRLDSRQVIAKKGYSVGRCAMLGELLRDCITDHGFPLICQHPLAKIWGGRDRKITHESFVIQCKIHRITLDDKHLKRTNQEERDAGLLAMYHLGTPINFYTSEKK